MTPDMGQMRSIAVYYHLCPQPRGEGFLAMWGHVRITCRNRENNQLLWEVARGSRDSGSHTRMSLACLNNSVGWQGAEGCYLEMCKLCARSLK